MTIKTILVIFFMMGGEVTQFPERPIFKSVIDCENAKNRIEMNLKNPEFQKRLPAGMGRAWSFCLPLRPEKNMFR